MTFVVLEGFSGVGKTTLARRLEKRGWLRLQESAHALPRHVPVAERGDTLSDFSLLGATLAYSSTIARMRKSRAVVSEGYLLSDLAYSKMRFELKRSAAYPAMLALCKEALSSPALRPDLYVLLEAGERTRRAGPPGVKDDCIGPVDFFRSRYYSALAEIHGELGERNVESVRTGPTAGSTLSRVLAAMSRRGVTEK